MDSSFKGLIDASKLIQKQVTDSDSGIESDDIDSVPYHQWLIIKPLFF